LIELAEHHREHVTERALESANNVGPCVRVVIDRVRDHWMRELEQRSATSTDEHAEIATESPRERSRSENAGASIRDLCAEIGQGSLQLFPRHDGHGSIVGWLTSGRQATVRDRPLREAATAPPGKYPSAIRFTADRHGTPGAQTGSVVMKTMVSTAGGNAPVPVEGPDELPPGAKCGPWVVERELGRGGMGAVYAVVHEEIGKRAALKIVHRKLLTPAFNIDRVMLEAKVVNAVGHPNIVDIFETGKLEDGRPYVVMERLEGQPLSFRADEGKILADQVIAILLQVCDALIAAHAAHIVHRDLKLDNVFLVDNADDPRSPKVKLLDWGIAKVINHDVRHTIEGQLVGTPQYLSPEQARGAAVTPQTDVYSLGVMAYELFLEQLPFEAETSAEIMAMHLRAIPPAPSELWPDIPTPLEDLLLLMLAKNPENRPTMLEVARRLESVRDELHRRQEARLALATNVVTIEPSQTRARTPTPLDFSHSRRHPSSGSGSAPRLASPGLAPTEPAESLHWHPPGRRWQYAVGVAALVASLMMFVISRTGETQVADAAAVPAQISDLEQPIAPTDLATAQVAVPTPVAPPNLAAEVMTGANPHPTTRASTHRATASSLRASTRKAPAMPRRAAARIIDPNGTIDPYQ
jgi:serine/threonine protein kinase